MELFPAIDLKDGQCVRLVHGDMGRATVFNDAPAEQARAFADAGCRWLHVVDLNGAFAGRPVNTDAVARILAATALKVQLGGGIRDAETIDAWLDAGITRVILGTAAVKDPDLVRDACGRHPGRIVVGVDAKDGKVAVEGWAEETEITAADLARRFADAGVAAIIYTDVDRDGALAGVNVAATVELTRVGVPVIASGGVASLADLRALKDTGVVGVIVGRALYDGWFGVADALDVLEI